MMRRSLTAAVAAAALGCAAGPAASEPHVDARAASPSSWSDALDEGVFGSDEAFGPRPASTPGGGAPLAADAARALDRDDLEDAARLLDRAVRSEIGATRAVYRRALGDALLGLGRDAEAALAYETAAAELPREAARTLAVLHGNLAVARWRRGDLDGATAAAERALELRPELAEALKTMGLISLARGREEAGLRALEEALARNPDLPEALLAIAETEERKGRVAAAVAAYRKLLDLSVAYETRDGHRRWRRLLGSTSPEPAPEASSSRAVTDEIRARVERLESRTHAATREERTP